LGNPQSRCFTEFTLSFAEGFSTTREQNAERPEKIRFPLAALCAFARDIPIWSPRG
jgi:hypothetical protein